MTDEFYGCPDCGAFNESFITKYHLSFDVTEEELQKLEEAFPLIFGRTDAEEFQECSVCEHEVEPRLVDSTERC